MALAEAHLVDRAGEFGPKELGRIGRRILDVVAPEIAEAAEAARLADLEAHAEQHTRLTMRRLGDGTTRISSRVPDAAATRLATYLEAYTNPRVERARHDRQDQQDQVTVGDPVARLSYPKRMGQAFVQLLESLDPTRLPLHGGDATTLVVTVSLDALTSRPRHRRPHRRRPRPRRRPHRRPHHRRPGPPPGLHREDPARRPRGRQPPARPRPHPPALQRDATPRPPVRDRTCRAEGCDVPATWCEAHHLDPWHTGGRTDLANAILLCSHHHHRVHDARYRVVRSQGGTFTFHLRR